METAQKLEPEFVERRSEERVGLGNVVAHADFGDGDPVMVCVWDLSLNGACLMVPPDVTFPERFTIIFDTAIRDAQLIWRTWTHAGVKFAEPL